MNFSLSTRLRYANMLAFFRNSAARFSQCLYPGKGSGALLELRSATGRFDCRELGQNCAINLVEVFRVK